MGDEPHSTLRLDDTVHQRARLGILTILQETGTADFSYLKSTLQLTDGNLGRHIEVLADGGMVQVEKGYEGRRPRTWITITKTGRAALATEMDSLKALGRSLRAGATLHDSIRTPAPAWGQLVGGSKEVRNENRAAPPRRQFPLRPAHTPSRLGQPGTPGRSSRFQAENLVSQSHDVA